MFAIRPLVVFVMFAAAAGVAGAQAATPRKVVESRNAFHSGDKKIRLEVFAPVGKDELPAIVLVPESKSLDEVGSIYRGAARLLAERGYLVALVHFFDRTGHKNVDPAKIKEEDFRAWMETVADGFRHVRDQLDPKRVRKDRVGLLGFSLGGFLALSAATDKKLNVKAVASYFGGIPDKLWPKVRYLPPTLLIHGWEDDVVCVQHCLAVHGVCDLYGIPRECKIYDDGHMFKKALKAYVLTVWLEHATGVRKGKFDAPLAIVEGLKKEPTVHDAVERGIRFFGKYLQPVEAAPEPKSKARKARFE